MLPSATPAMQSAAASRAPKTSHGPALGGALGPVLVADEAAALCVAGVALDDIHRFQLAWHNLTSTVAPSHIHRVALVLMALGGALGPVLVARDAAALCVAGVALGDTHVCFTWQAWHHLTSTAILRGRRGTHGTDTHLGFISRTFLSHTICHTPFFTQTLLTHHQSYNLCILCKQFSDAHLCHIPSVTDHLSHTLCHIPTFTHNFVAHLFSHTHTHLCHTPSVTDHFSHTLCHIPLMLSIGRS